MVSSSELDCFVGEVAKQVNHMNSLYNGLPEKEGELIANMFWLVKCKILKKIRRKKLLKSSMRMKGMLIDRQHGANVVVIEYNLSSTFSSSQRHTLQVCNAFGGVMDTAKLCSHVQKLLFQS